ncbi:MAG: Hpt domain-containing protein [Pseudomonadota bacterium]
MAMAMKVDIGATCKNAGTERPIDLVHLSSLTMGDSALESEVLGMFAAQLPTYIAALVKANSPEAVFHAAHTLKGAAKSMGAFRLSEIAADLEATRVVDQAQISTEADRVIAYINELR